MMVSTYWLLLRLWFAGLRTTFAREADALDVISDFTFAALGVDSKYKNGGLDLGPPFCVSYNGIFNSQYRPSNHSCPC